MDGIEVLIILFFVLISILDAIGRSRRKRQGEQGGKAARRPPRPAAGTDAADGPGRGDGEPYGGATVAVDATRVDPAARVEEPATSEGLVPKDIWEEIAGLVLEGQQGRGGGHPGGEAQRTPELPAPSRRDEDMAPYERPETSRPPEWRSWTLDAPPGEGLPGPGQGKHAGRPEPSEEDWRDETRRARFPVPSPGGSPVPAPRPRWEVGAVPEPGAATPSPPRRAVSRRAHREAVARESAEEEVARVARLREEGTTPLWPDPRELLRSRNAEALRQAFILKEVLGPPRALREHGE